MTQLLKEYGNEMEKQIKVVSLEVKFFSATFLRFSLERDRKTITKKIFKYRVIIGTMPNQRLRYFV